LLHWWQVPCLLLHLLLCLAPLHLLLLLVLLLLPHW
jgi:hypothetical protein